jgi:hypothetical protein
MLYILLSEKKKEEEEGERKREKKGEKMAKGLFHRIDTLYGLYHAGIFLTVRCN